MKLFADTCERDYQHADECLAPDEDAISRVLTIHDYAFLRNQNRTCHRLGTAALAVAWLIQSRSKSPPSHAIAMLGYDRRFTADWAQDNERRAAAQRDSSATLTSWRA